MHHDTKKCDLHETRKLNLNLKFVQVRCHQLKLLRILILIFCPLIFKPDFIKLKSKFPGEKIMKKFFLNSITNFSNDHRFLKAKKNSLPWLSSTLLCSICKLIQVIATMVNVGYIKMRQSSFSSVIDWIFHLQDSAKEKKENWRWLKAMEKFFFLFSKISLRE